MARSHCLLLFSVVALFPLVACGSDEVLRTDEAPTAANEPAPPPAAVENAKATGLYAIDARALDGTSAPLSTYVGQVTLVVNVASKCGYTPQYTGLQALQERYASQGFKVLAFPSNEFGGQEPGDAATIREFCTQNFGVEFPLFEKCETKAGAGQSPVYAFLGEQTGELPGWNFCKYLVGRDGQVLRFFQSKTTPEDAHLLGLIDTALERPQS
jgi:glutathione peroxidase